VFRLQMLGQAKRRSRSRANAPAVDRGHWPSHRLTVSDMPKCKIYLVGWYSNASVRNLLPLGPGKRRASGPGPILPRSRPHRGIGHELRDQPFASHFPESQQRLPALRLQSCNVGSRGSRTLLLHALSLDSLHSCLPEP
jgi:hypothetical protein